MAYVPNNLGAFIAAYAGAISGMAVSGRVITDPVAADYAGQTAIAFAFAQEFDTLYSGPSSTLAFSTIQEATEAVWQNISPSSNNAENLVPTTFSPICDAIIALLQESNVIFVTQGVPTTAPVAGSVPLSRVRYVDPDSTAGGTPNGSIAAPFLNIQSAYNSLPVGNGAIYLCPISDGSYGGLTIPPGTSGKLSLIGISALTSPSVLLFDPIDIGSGSTIEIGFANVGMEAPITGDGAIHLQFTNCSLDGDITLPNASTIIEMFNCATSGTFSVGGTITAVVTQAIGGLWTAPQILVDGTTDYYIVTNATGTVPTVITEKP